MDADSESSGPADNNVLLRKSSCHSAMTSEGRLGQSEAHLQGVQVQEGRIFAHDFSSVGAALGASCQHRGPVPGDPRGRSERDGIR